MSPLASLSRLQCRAAARGNRGAIREEIEAFISLSSVHLDSITVFSLCTDWCGVLDCVWLGNWRLHARVFLQNGLLCAWMPHLRHVRQMDHLWFISWDCWCSLWAAKWHQKRSYGYMAIFCSINPDEQWQEADTSCSPLISSSFAAQSRSRRDAFWVMWTQHFDLCWAGLLCIGTLWLSAGLQALPSTCWHLSCLEQMQGGAVGTSCQPSANCNALGGIMITGGCIQNFLVLISRLNVGLK